MRRRAANPDGSMTFLEHLEEFRTRLIRVLIALAVGIGISFPFRNKLFNLLLLPQKIRVQNIIADATAWLSSRFFPSEFWQFFELWLRATATDETPFTPNFRSPMDPYTTLFKMCIVIGLILASPILLYQTWAFIVPALKRTERGIAVRLGALMGVFFLLGVTFAFFIVAPLLLELSANLWHSSE
ncbi:MAG: twin-arginine translocase subunit TatC, partial [Candidatus Poribacteria bacterium]|nr:twin-arginine translocase subunit TatC [Candidatus Poribacteria bacterium]